MNDTEPETGSAADAETGTAAGTGSTSVSEPRSTVVAHATSIDDDAPAPPGRPVRLEPTPPGFWRLVLGAIVALLAPLFGILIGSGMGSRDAGRTMEPLYWGFFVGGFIGVLGLVAVALGVVTLLRHSRARNPEENS